MAAPGKYPLELRERAVRMYRTSSDNPIHGCMSGQRTSTSAVTVAGEELLASFKQRHWDTGCKWRALPRDFPPWSTGYKFFARWAAAGVVAVLRDQLRRKVRTGAGKTPRRWR